MTSATFVIEVQGWSDLGVLEAAQWHTLSRRQVEARPGDTAEKVAWDTAVDLNGLSSDQRIVVFRGGGPALTVTSESLALIDPKRRNVPRAAKANHRPRTRGPVFEVVSKVVPTDDLLGKRVLVSADKSNQVGVAAPGCSYRVAAHPAATTVPVRVRGVGSLTLRGREYTTLHTEVGEIRLPSGAGVIPV